ncbi:AMP-binding protein [Kineococcus sp. SYSU DK003]|uniref:AMP-binding protein n=1 Tax=Kineococcus sp. SYSU DK003 TaxID=3383124 RepID=UPI003D7D48D2
MPDLSIGAAFRLLADRAPRAVAVRCGEAVLTRAELDQRATRLARRWIAHGLRVDDVVTICLPNSPDFVVATVAAWKAGATPQPLSPRLPARERVAVLELTAPRVVVDGGLPAGIDGPDLPDLAASSWKAPTSSGSTGRPKVVRATDPARVDPDGTVAPFVPREAVQLVSGPLFHAAPFVYAFRGLMTGHELVLLPRFDAGEWLRAVEDGATWAVLVPATMHRILRHPRRAATDVGSLARILHLGARCAPWLKRAWIDWLGADRVEELYAGTESQGLAFVGGREWLRRPGTVGRPLPGSRFRIARADGSPCGPGEVGEVLMRRDRPTYSYLGAEPVVRDGWHTLGDAGWCDEDGYLFLADRLDDVITSAGVAIAPAEVEAVLEEHPAVGSAVVVGRPDAERGQVVHAVVQGAVVEGQLREWVRTRLDPEKAPRSYEFVSEPPRDDTGKVRRSRWR